MSPGSKSCVPFTSHDAFNVQGLDAAVFPHKLRISVSPAHKIGLLAQVVHATQYNVKLYLRQFERLAGCVSCVGRIASPYVVTITLKQHFTLDTASIMNTQQ